MRILNKVLNKVEEEYLSGNSLVELKPWCEAEEAIERRIGFEVAVSLYQIVRDMLHET